MNSLSGSHLIVVRKRGRNMDQVQISVKENEANWKERCYGRVEILKARVNSHVCLEKYSTAFDMQEAVKNGDVDNFVDTLEKVCSDNKLPLSDIFYEVTPAGDSLLHEAAYFGMTNIAELIGYHFPRLLTKTNVKGDTPLHVAARAKSSNVIKVILSHCNANAQESASFTENKDEQRITRLKNEHGNTALHEAVCSDHVDGTTLLFHADECVAHYLNKSGQSPLYMAVLTGNKDIVRVLLEAPFPDDKPLPNCHGISPLHAAICSRNAALIKEILAKNQDLMNLTDEDGGTPLHYAATEGFVEGVRMILDKSALSALKWNAKGHFPIDLACKWGDLKVVKEFLEHGRVHDCRVLVNQKGQNILHIAAKNGRHNVVKYLLRNTRIDVNEKDKDGNTPLHLAAKNSFPHILYYLTRDKRTRLNLVNNEGFTAQDTHWLQLKLPRTARQWLSVVVFLSIGAQVSNKAKSIVYKRVVPLKVGWMRNGINTLMLVAILISTVTFAAGFTVPGSVYGSDDANPHNRGMAVLVNRTMFKIFVIFNTVAMYCSIFGCILLMWAQLGDYYFARRFFLLASGMVGMALLTMSLAFMAAVRLVVSEVTWLANVITIIGFIVLSFIAIMATLLGAFPYGFKLPIAHNHIYIRTAISLYGSAPKVNKSSASQEETMQEQEQ